MNLAYKGTTFYGWQKTKEGPSIEESLEDVLTRVLQHPVKLKAASRTDRGVHAHGQIVTFQADSLPLPVERLKLALNSLLPETIRVNEVTLIETAPVVKGKIYHYHLCNSAVQMPFQRSTSWHFPYPIDLDLVKEEATYLLGQHDFTTFCNQIDDYPEDRICVIEKISIERVESDRLLFSIQGDRFLYKMVRTIVGTLAHIGCGKLSSMEKILASKDRKRAGITAPAHGLTLNKVLYEL